jgi:hypothetical protein
MKRLYRIIFLTGLIIAFFLVVDLNKNNADPAAASDSSHSSASKTVEIGKSGGTISLKTAEGYTLTLSIPQDAIAGTVQVKLMALSARIENAIANNLFPGISIEPLKLRLKEPASLKIQFPEKKKLPVEALLYSVAEKDFVLPLSDQKVESGTNTISGTFCIFRQYAAGIPSRKEMDDQIHKLKIFLDSEKLSTKSFTTKGAGIIPVSFNNRLDTGIGILTSILVWPPRSAAAAAGPAGNKKYDCHGWQDTYDEVGALMGWVQRYTLRGNEPAADDAEKRAKNAVERAVKSFLERNRPLNRCAEGYFRAALKYDYISYLTGLSKETSDALTKRVNEVLVECGVRLNFTIDNEGEKKRDSYYEEHGKLSGDITCHLDSQKAIFHSGNDTNWTGCEGRLEYEDDLEHKYNHAFGWTLTKSAAGRIEVTGSGHNYEKNVAPGLNDAQAATAFSDAMKAAAAKCAGEGVAATKCIETETAAALAAAAAAKNATGPKSELWIMVSLKFKPLITGRSCDTNPSNSPQCEDFEITEMPLTLNFSNQIDMPFKDGYRDGITVNNPKNGDTGHYYTTLHILKTDLSDQDDDPGCY